jgi:hypothetical protein
VASPFRSHREDATIELLSSLDQGAMTGSLAKDLPELVEPGLG